MEATTADPDVYDEPGAGRWTRHHGPDGTLWCPPTTGT